MELGGFTFSGSGKLHVIKVDVTEEESIKAGAVEELRILDGRNLDYVVNNAAVVGGFMRDVNAPEGLTHHSVCLVGRISRRVHIRV